MPCEGDSIDTGSLIARQKHHMRCGCMHNAIIMMEQGLPFVCQWTHCGNGCA